MIPASNMKLLTTGAALHALGADFNFATRMLREDDRLIIVGDGDPAFGDPGLLPAMTVPGGGAMDTEAFLNLWTQPVVDAGMTTVSEVIVDDRVFDREFTHPTWPTDQLNQDYCAQVAGLNFHANVLHFFPKPRPGQPPDIGDMRPRAPWLKITNNATSSTGGKSEHTPWVARKIGTNEMSFRGNVRFASTSPVDVTLHDPPDFFARLLADRLQRCGVSVHIYRSANASDPQWQGQALGPAIVTPMATVIRRCNEDSENLYAESLLKRIGRHLTGEPGSFSNGGAILRHIVHERVSDPALAGTLVVSDGSGLSRDNRLSAGLMTTWLDSFHNDPVLGPVFIDSLAVGAESGTLRKRYQAIDLRGATVQAKTGYIKGVSCLSGFVTSADGHRYSFSVLVNGFPEGGISAAKKVQDQVVTAIAKEMAQSNVTLGSD
jgi:D-alanyl-D-alanine carboxypeptidase/D-alanyl-D-alanine-endopeptidase (penicillin-binding protein 4)